MKKLNFLRKYLLIKQAKARFGGHVEIKDWHDGTIWIKTTSDRNHDHWYNLDFEGNGTTMEEDDYPPYNSDIEEYNENVRTHIHSVNKWIVSSTDGHTHYFKVNWKTGENPVSDKMIKDSADDTDQEDSEK